MNHKGSNLKAVDSQASPCTASLTAAASAFTWPQPPGMPYTPIACRLLINGLHHPSGIAREGSWTAAS